MPLAKHTYLNRKLLKKAKQDNAKLVFDRFEEQQPLCPFGITPLGDVCCKNCYNGPCRIIPKKQERGICGATADVIVARNLLRHAAAGVACHGDHAREAALLLLKIVQGKAPDYKIKNEIKLRMIARKLGKKSAGPIMEVAKEVVLEALEDYRRQEGLFHKKEGEFLNWTRISALPERIKLWKKLDILPINIDMETSHAEHQTTMGNDADPHHIMLSVLRQGIADGAAMRIATDMQDILFKIPKIIRSEANLGVLKKNYVNIAVHGHSPLLSDKVVEWARKLDKRAKEVGAEGVNIIGVCCTGNEVLMRHGIPLAASEIRSEMVIATGALEAMVVDMQCIYPSVQEVAHCYHTKIITSIDYVRIPGAVHIPFKIENADKTAQKIVMTGINNFKNRSSRIFIPPEKFTMYGGFSAEAVINLFKKVDSADPIKPLMQNLKDGNIKGIVAVVGCRNPKLRGYPFHEELMKILIKDNILVIVTGCAAHAAASAGLMAPGASEKYAGKKLASVINAVSKANNMKEMLPPVWHMGSCVDNSRIEQLLTPIAKKLKKQFHNLPIAASAPEYVTEKSVAIACWALASGITTHINPIPPITGSRFVTNLLTRDIEKITGSRVLIGETPQAAAREIIKHINKKRKELKWK
ncbi:anaerobic carbon-monoxide dehydrogenase catalytic subunit [Candidatus Woesearchaeota archaeon]|nr:anaerobic carbon-monoxide dehydrogenase catalytic subunit [Candidatus Woesearchaeota archaeon]